MQWRSYVEASYHAVRRSKNREYVLVQLTFNVEQICEKFSMKAASWLYRAFNRPSLAFHLGYGHAFKASMIRSAYQFTTDGASMGSYREEHLQKTVFNYFNLTVSFGRVADSSSGTSGLHYLQVESSMMIELFKNFGGNLFMFAGTKELQRSPSAAAAFIETYSYLMDNSDPTVFKPHDVFMGDLPQELLREFKKMVVLHFGSKNPRFLHKDEFTDALFSNGFSMLDLQISDIEIVPRVKILRHNHWFQYLTLKNLHSVLTVEPSDLENSVIPIDEDFKTFSLEVGVKLRCGSMFTSKSFVFKSSEALLLGKDPSERSVSISLRVLDMMGFTDFGYSDFEAVQLDSFLADASGPSVMQMTGSSSAQRSLSRTEASRTSPFSGEMSSSSTAP